jgi:hypothetical protein
MHITETYAEMYLRNPAVYKWAGMAALTSATVGKGMYLALTMRYTGLTALVGLFHREAGALFEKLVEGNLLVFADIYWQHLAFEQAGLAELDGIYQEGGLDRLALDAWRLIDEGRRDGQPAQIWQGNIELLKFEQERVLQPGIYDAHAGLWQEVAGWVPSPIPGQVETFGDFHAGGNIAVFADRWRWIERRMLPRWQMLSDNYADMVDRRLSSCIHRAVRWNTAPAQIPGWRWLAPAHEGASL